MDIFKAVYTGDINILKEVIRNGADVNALSNFQQTPLHLALALIKYEISEDVKDKLSELEPENPTPTNWGLTLFSNINLEPLQETDSKKNKVPADVNENIPFDEAKTDNYFKIIQELIARGANVNVLDRLGRNTLHQAASCTNPNIIQMLIAAGAHIHATDHLLGETPLHKASKGNNPEVIQELITAGADIHAKNHWDETPLHWASRGNNPEVIQALIAAGADIHAKNNRGETPLHWASNSNNPEMIKRLIATGAEIHATDSGGWTPLHRASAFNNPKVVQVLMAVGADTHATSHSGDTPLHIASAFNDPKVVQVLMAAGADIHATNHSGETPLHKAAGLNNPEMIQVLLAAGADIDATNNEQCTALHFATNFDNPTAIQELINRGANADAKHLNQQTALDMAKENNNFPIMKVLLKSGANKLLLESIKNYAVEKKTGKILKEIITTCHQDLETDNMAVINSILENYYKIHRTEPIAHPDQNQNTTLHTHLEDTVKQQNKTEQDIQETQQIIDESVAIYGVASMPDRIDDASDADMNAFRTARNSSKALCDKKRMRNINHDGEDKKPAAKKDISKGL